MTNQTIARRVRHLELRHAGAIRAACETCRGQPLQIVHNDDPMPKTPCPQCDRDIAIIHLDEREDDPQ